MPRPGTTTGVNECQKVLPPPCNSWFVHARDFPRRTVQVQQARARAPSVINDDDSVGYQSISLCFYFSDWRARRIKSLKNRFSFYTVRRFYADFKTNNPFEENPVNVHDTTRLTLVVGIFKIRIIRFYEIRILWTIRMIRNIGFNRAVSNNLFLCSNTYSSYKTFNIIVLNFHYNKKKRLFSQ